MTQTPGWYFCLKCGAELSADARFCPICGHPVGGTRTRSQSGDSLVEVGGEQLPLASVGKRLGALIVDGLVWGAAFYALFFIVFFAAVIASIDEMTGESDLSISTGPLIALRKSVV